DDQRLEDSTYPVLKLVDCEIKPVDEPALSAVNMRLRDDYTADCQRGLDRWNKVIDRTGVAFKLELPHVGFHRDIGEFKEVKVTPAGEVRRPAAWEAGRHSWLACQHRGEFILTRQAAAAPPRRLPGPISPPAPGPGA